MEPTKTEPTKTDNAASLEDQLIAILKTVYDPELPVNIYDLGLIYEIRIHPDDTVLVRMTLTAPNCPVAGILPGQVEEKLRAHPDVKDARVELTFDPPFDREMMSDEAKLALGFL